MRASRLTPNSAREKLKELRQAARTLKPEVEGAERERAEVAMKDFKNWSDLRNRAIRPDNR